MSYTLIALDIIMIIMLYIFVVFTGLVTVKLFDVISDWINTYKRNTEENESSINNEKNKKQK